MHPRKKGKSVQNAQLLINFFVQNAKKCDIVQELIDFYKQCYKII